MEVLVRESTFGRLANYFTKDRIFPYPDFSDSSANIKSSPPESLSNKDKRRLHSVDWSGPNDPDKPMNWPTGAKFVVMIEVTALNFSFYAAAAIFTPSIPEIEEEFRVSSAAGTLGLSLFVTAYGIGPLILSPLSNIPSIGRTPVYIIGLLSFFVLQIGTAVAENMQTVLILRFLAGFLGSAPISVGGATLSEIYRPSRMPYAIAFYAVSGVCGPIFGPIIGTGAILQWGTWRASLWLLAGIAAFSLVFTFMFLPETLYDNILLRRARKLRRETGDNTIRSQSEVDTENPSISLRIAKQVVQDFKMSFADPIIIFINLYTMLIYGVLYVWFEFFPFVFAGIYHFSSLQQSLAFFGILVGAIISVVAYLLWLRLSFDPTAAEEGLSCRPEARLLPGQVGAICIPICLFIFAWTARADVHWIAPIMGTAFFAPGFYLTFQSVLNYLGESYPRHVAGVFAGNTFFRSSFGGALPLAAPAMLNRLGIGWASSVLGFISVVFVPLPFILERYGERLRKWSSYAD